MSTRNMKLIVAITAATVLLVTTATTSYAMMSIEIVSKERAQALGVEVRAKAAGPKQVWVELEFKAEGALKHFSHVSMEIRDGKELLVGYAPMEAHRTGSGTLVFRFMASRLYLDKITLSIVEGQPLNMIGHELRLKDFVDLKNLSQ